ncbi:hypothetical protein C4668_24700, partial [Salmonella enterica subsp. enterica serovar Anatum]
MQAPDRRTGPELAAVTTRTVILFDEGNPAAHDRERTYVFDFEEDVMATNDTDTGSGATAPASGRTPAIRALAIAVAMSLVIATVLLAFSWPTLKA